MTYAQYRSAYSLFQTPPDVVCIRALTQLAISRVSS